MGFSRSPEVMEAMQKEVAKMAREKFVQDISTGMLKEISSTFEQSTNEREKLPFHDTEHTQFVIDATRTILEAMQRGGVDVSEADFATGKLAASAHDVIQGWAPKHEANGAEKRQRFIGMNEQLSIMMIQEKMREMNEKHGIVFTEEQIAIVDEAIKVTEPEFIFAELRVVQAKLTTETSPVARAVAMADLGAAGMNSAEFIKGGDALFREENLDMLSLDVTKLTDEQKETYKKRMLGWSSGQPKFARDRQAAFEQDVAPLPEQAQAELRAIFTAFPESIRLAEERAKERASMTFEELYAVMYEK